MTLLNLTDLSSEPLHSQISRQLRAKILAAEIEEGVSLPSIRVFAREHRVSVITVQRAYDDLEHEGLILARRGKGFFVAPMSDQKRERRAQQRFIEAIEQLLDEAIAEGLGLRTIRQLFTKALSEKEGRK